VTGGGPQRLVPPILEVERLTVRLRDAGGERELLSAVSFALAAGESFALVGESGCGKSLTCLALARLLPEPPFVVAGGTVRICGRDVAGLSPRELRALRGGTVGYIFQEPGTALNPVLRVGGQIAEAVRLHDPGEREVRGRVLGLLRQVGIPEPEARRRAYPHQLSGGMQQRVMVAMALACRPRLLVADEPTTALDVTVQAQILELLQRLRRETGAAVLLVTHNLGIVADFADRVAVMYAGQVVETGPARALLLAPRHPYTRALLAAVPRLGAAGGRELRTIPGRVPPPGEWPPGCRFAPRCAEAGPECAAPPEPRPAGPGCMVRCVRTPHVGGEPAAGRRGAPALQGTALFPCPQRP
jgi:oligopeptide/dipeptide ABC transporter ATP-binding protein